MSASDNPRSVALKVKHLERRLKVLDDAVNVWTYEVRDLKWAVERPALARFVEQLPPPRFVVRLPLRLLGGLVRAVGRRLP